jgi:hypothetical protein
LVASTALAVRDVKLRELGAYRRLWSDLALSIATYIDHAYPAGREKPQRLQEGLDPEQAAMHLVLWRIEMDGLRPTQPFRTVRERPFQATRLRPEPRPYDDKGRAVLLGWAFRLRGGIAPFLILWLAPLLALAVVAWSAVELCAAGSVRAALAWVTLLAWFPYVPEALTLTRYPVGFYLLAVLMIVPLAAYATASRSPTPRGLLVRALAAGGGFALCVYCRSSTILLTPGFFLALGLGLRRVVPDTRRRLGLGGVALVLFLAPLPLAKVGQQNDVWQPLWEGLGDFDRTKGYTWSDAVALERARLAGASELWTPESEAAFREQMLRDVRDDPAWYAAILARRLFATVSLQKLWPWGPRDGAFMRRQDSANEGVIDKYWTYSATIDHVGAGRWRFELPVSVLLLPAAIVLAGALRRRPFAWRAATLGACVAAGTLGLPVLVTTAGGVEAQAFGLVHLLLAACLAEALPPARAPADRR